MRLAAGMAHQPYPSPDAAIRAVTGGSPLDARGIDYGHVSGGASGPWQLAARLDRDAMVRAILGQFPERRQRVLVGYAWKVSCTRLAAYVGASETSIRRWYQQDRRALATRLEEVGLLESSGA